MMKRHLAPAMAILIGSAPSWVPIVAAEDAAAIEACREVLPLRSATSLYERQQIAGRVYRASLRSENYELKVAADRLLAGTTTDQSIYDSALLRILQVCTEVFRTANASIEKDAGH